MYDAVAIDWVCWFLRIRELVAYPIVLLGLGPAVSYYERQGMGVP